MLTEKIKNYLSQSKEELIEFTPMYQGILQEFGKKEKLGASFVEFMSKYDSEIHGEEGFIINGLDDVFEYETSMTKHLIDTYNIPIQYISLFNLEIDDYLLYNKENDTVKLIEAKNIGELSNDEYYDQKWGSFNEFLEYFFNLNQ
ncbi:hypothetical protein R5N98_05210 [Tenacibaculum maritimum]|uniref:Knr4/Smi1-like domain-containing protein n=1 Tax=Tenacibaculum maritimum NCIMB 2154 TaxID=1349785 RepID=A0A2H1E8M3_9FLAO|nr:hypothetical protein [Tenacibaculum maritimum]MCD9583324.1 hypothetical protein [Tenacibaculum maritimum]MCD9637388.1 hypothetical protein [Tenacibaculum maritimum]MDB0601996.1 hypothetical protein [Tenacibaculum maritimum]MDB0613237.1 hypothetical protein [Tenacibaculum maritimum]CAA0146928.1 conserved hypothetical protein [Tenacibaculum maritimum]